MLLGQVWAAGRQQLSAADDHHCDATGGRSEILVTHGHLEVSYAQASRVDRAACTLRSPSRLAGRSIAVHGPCQASWSTAVTKDRPRLPSYAVATDRRRAARRYGGNGQRRPTLSSYFADVPRADWFGGVRAWRPKLPEPTVALWLAQVAVVRPRGKWLGGWTMAVIGDGASKPSGRQ